jgi:asparagine synthase (glutamine-hydrolysing)
VASYCFGIPPEQFLTEGIDRSLIRRAMWGLLPEIVATNRMNGLQSPDWYEKLERRREILMKEIFELSASPLARRAIDLDRLGRAIKRSATTAIVSTPRTSFAGAAVCVRRPMSTTWLVTC